MKICMLLSVSLCWSITANAGGQNVPEANRVVWVSVADLGDTRAAAGYGTTDCGDEGDCQVLWGTYRHGQLWENYCFEKGRYQARETRPHTRRKALFEPIRRRQISCDAPITRRVASRHGQLQRERIICFDLFFELFGWKQCTCRTHSCQTPGPCREHSASPPTDPLLAAPPVPADEDEPADAAPPQSDRGMPTEDQWDGFQGTAEPESTEGDPSTPDPEGDPGDVADPLPLDDPAPAVPRNTIPPIKPATPEETPSERTTREPALPGAPLHGTVKAMVAERLSDYIQIR